MTNHPEMQPEDEYVRSKKKLNLGLKASKNQPEQGQFEMHEFLFLQLQLPTQLH